MGAFKMRLLVIAERKSKIEPFLPAFRAKGFEVKYIRILKIGLVSKGRNVLVKTLGENIPQCDAVFLQCRSSLAPFIEPLLEEFVARKIYCNSRLGSYYVGMNEPYKFVTLALGGADISRLAITGSAASTDALSKKERYPLLIKALLGNSVQQSMVVSNEKDFDFFLKSIQGKIDAFMVHEYPEGDIVTCAVIGQKVFAIKRKFSPSAGVSELSRGKIYKLSDEEMNSVIKASRTCGYDIAQVELVNGKVFDVTVNVKWNVFNEICSENLEEHVAQFFYETMQLLGIDEGASEKPGIVKKFLSKTFFRGFLK
ncbi:MAG: hypothetical protein WC308_02155 [archaeon]